MILLTKIILAHLIGDFVLQPKSFVDHKEENKLKSWRFYVHILVHGLLLLVLVWDINYWSMVLTLMLAHGLIDILKIYAQKESTKAKWYIIDQLLHFISIVLIYAFWVKPEWDLTPWIQNSKVWVYGVAFLFITLPTSITMQVLMSNWSQSLDDSSDASLGNAGKYIGILERLFVFTFVISGNWEAIGFLLAAKSVFRFGDLKESKDRKLTEYILIGTLLSFGIAMAAGLITLHLTNNF